MVALVGLETGPLDGQPVMGQAKGGQQAEVLGVSSREPVPVSRQRSVTGPFPIPPVRRGSSTLTLCGRGTRAPEEAFRPTHAHEYGKKGARPPHGQPTAAGNGPPAPKAIIGKALCDPLVSRVVGVEVVREITCIGRAEQGKPAYLVEMVVPEAALHLNNRLTRTLRIVRLCAASPRSLDSHHRVGLGKQRPGMILAEGGDTSQRRN